MGGLWPAENAAADLAGHDWIFNIDADERVSAELAQAVLAADIGRHSGFRVARENYFGKRRIRHCGWYPDLNLRFYDRRRAAFSDRSVHEAVRCTEDIGVLTGNLVHYSYSGIAVYLLRMNRYSTLAAAEIVKAGRMPRVADLLYRPLFTFFKMFVLKRGFLDGYHGLLLATLYAVYTFAKYAKAIEIVDTAMNRSGLGDNHDR